MDTIKTKLCKSLVIRQSRDSEYVVTNNYKVQKHTGKRNSQQRFFEFMNYVIGRLMYLDKVGTAKNYKATLNSFKTFCGSKEISFKEITPYLMEEYQAWLISKGVKYVYTSVEKTVKRAISINDIKRIKNLDLSHNKSFEMARDIFMFLFYTRGMSFIDAVFLKKTDIVAGEIVYRRHKTNQQLTIVINRHIQQLLDLYQTTNSPYLLPIVSPAKQNPRRQYENALRRINNALKKIAALANISSNLTTYTPRHSWATIAKQKGISTAIISDALGHDSEKTTQIYLASISSYELSLANDLVLSSL